MITVALNRVGASPFPLTVTGRLGLLTEHMFLNHDENHTKTLFFIRHASYFTNFSTLNPNLMLI